jgi:CheY-like chemotaxis protein
MSSPSTDRTILLVDDNDDDVFLMQTIFRRIGIAAPMHVVQNGEEAVAYVAGKGEFADRQKYPLPAMILLDLNMPRMNGFEFLKWLRQQPKLMRITVDVLTASNRPGDVERAFDAGANGYFVKPSRMEELSEMVESWYRLTRFRAFPILQ